MYNYLLAIIKISWTSPSINWWIFFCCETGVPRSTVDASNTSASSLHVYEKRPRVPSHRLRELTRGKFIVNYKDITLLESIGEGCIQTLCMAY